MIDKSKTAAQFLWHQQFNEPIYKSKHSINIIIYMILARFGSNRGTDITVEKNLTHLTFHAYVIYFN